MKHTEGSSTLPISSFVQLKCIHVHLKFKTERIKKKRNQGENNGSVVPYVLKSYQPFKAHRNAHFSLNASPNPF
jgi:hypothetical protein